jgi:hypothetical protein
LCWLAGWVDGREGGKEGRRVGRKDGGWQGGRGVRRRRGCESVWLWLSLPWACLHPPLPTLEPGLHAIAAQSSCSSAPCPPSVQCSESISQPNPLCHRRRVGGGLPSTRMISSPPPFLFSRSKVLDHQAGCACSLQLEDDGELQTALWPSLTLRFPREPPPHLAAHPSFKAPRRR